MNKQEGFTLIELLVVIAIIALLMAILMPSLNRAKKQTKAVVCQANLHQWSLVFSLYMDENNGYFCYGDSSGQWRWVLQTQQPERKLSVCCPEASNPNKPVGAFKPWGADSRLDSDYVMQTDFGSYGLNRWVYNRKTKSYWKGRNVKGVNQIPLFQDCSWYGARPQHMDNPPAYDGHIAASGPGFTGDNMRRVCLNRHSGATCVAFLDISVRKIGLKELWTLRWNRLYETENIRTKAGGARPEDWPQWMRNFKDY